MMECIHVGACAHTCTHATVMSYRGDLKNTRSKNIWLSYPTVKGAPSLCKVLRLELGLQAWVD